MLKKNKKKELSFVKKNLILIFCCLTLVCFMSIGYSALNQTLFISGEVALRAVKDIRISNLQLVSTSNGGYEQYNSNFTINSISLSAHLPNVGSSVTYTATIKNKGTVPMEVSELTGSTSVSGVSYKIDGLEVGTVTEAGSTTTFTITLTRTTTVNTTDDSVSALVEISWIESVPPYTDPVLAGNAPNLLNDSLTPVVYNGTNWVVANPTQEWYNYSNQEWANAVILEDGVTKNVGDTITVPTASSTTTEVRAMYVWIPRYEYKIEGTYGTHTDGTTGTKALPGEIEVNFIPTTKTSASSGYILHPAFQWDTDSNGTIIASENIAGIWVGKFETSADASSTCYASSSTTNCNNANQEPYILPNVSSLRYQNVSNQFITAQKFGTYLSNSASVDSHMMKNSEWGAVAYLSQSSYGKYGNSSYTGANKEVYKNDSRGFYTGRSSGLPSASGSSASGTCYYDNITDRGDGTGACGAGASTTGNIYGVYDMSGGSHEYVMGYLTTANSNYTSNPNSYFGRTESSNDAGFTSKPADKYFDNYTTTTNTTACNGVICYGHALSETSGWYSDSANFVNAYNPWFRRGGHYGDTTHAGVFYALRSNGYVTDYDSFRSVLLAE